MIIICEPHFRGFGHAQFNAALVCSVAEAFPEEELIFCAEREHLNHVKRIVDTHVATVRFVEVELPDRALREEQRGRRLPFAALLEELALYRRIFRLADKNRASQIVFCTAAHRNDLVIIKVMLRRFSQIACLVVLHDLQNKISTPQPKRLTLSSFHIDTGFSPATRRKYITYSRDPRPLWNKDLRTTCHVCATVFRR